MVIGDDFGFSHSVNRAIVDAHEKGILTGASLMVTGDAADEAIEIARRTPTLSVGLHLVVVCGRAVLPPQQVPHIADKQGRFSDNPVKAGFKYFFSRQARRELRMEIRAQLQRCVDSGITPSRVDGHLHMHVHPVVMRALVDAAAEFGIKRIRLPKEELGPALGIDRAQMFIKTLLASVFGMLHRYESRILKEAGIEFPERVYGLLLSGRVTEQRLARLVPLMKGWSVEFYCHPAYDDQGDPLNGPPGAGPRELAALLSDTVRSEVEAAGFDLSRCTAPSL